MSECQHRVGPVWKLGGETCTCIKRKGHEMPHECSCGAWFESPNRAADM
jgi:hypothetical protein